MVYFAGEGATPVGGAPVRRHDRNVALTLRSTGPVIEISVQAAFSCALDQRVPIGKSGRSTFNTAAASFALRPTTRKKNTGAPLPGRVPLRISACCAAVSPEWTTPGVIALNVAPCLCRHALVCGTP